MVFDLAFIWAGLIALAVLMYVILDGFDLGIGCPSSEFLEQLAARFSGEIGSSFD